MTPLRCSYFDFSFSRSLTMRVMSTLKTVWTCGLVRLDSTMRWAMMERILVMGTSSPGCGWGAAGFAGAGGGAERCRSRRGSGSRLWRPAFEVAEDVFLGDAA